MRDDYILKPATTQHADGISRVIRDAIARVNAKDYPPAEIDRLLQNFTAERVLQLLGQRQTLVALAGDDIIGTGALHGAEVKSVFVAPDWHRRGVATALVRELERIAKRQGTQTLEVSSSLSATAFYTAMGFQETSRSFYGDEETVLMSKPLG
ncbi:GNAT family N-acetyltransferase [Gymnodinialimonas sp.]